MKIACCLFALFLTGVANAQTPSPENTKVPPALVLTVPSGIDVWRLGRPDPALPGMFEIVVDELVIPRARASQLGYCKGSVYAKGRTGAWFRATDGPLGITWTLVTAYPCDVVPPPPGPISQTITMDWQLGAVKPDKSDEPDSTRIYRDGAQVASVAVPTVTYEDKVTVATGTEVCYEVSAVNEAGESPRSNRACKTVK